MAIAARAGQAEGVRGVFYCSPSHMSKKLDQKLSSWDLNQHSIMQCRGCIWFLNPLLHYTGPVIGLR